MIYTLVQIGSDPELMLNRMETFLWEDMKALQGLGLFQTNPLRELDAVLYPQEEVIATTFLSKYHQLLRGGGKFPSASLAGRRSGGLY